MTGNDIPAKFINRPEFSRLNFNRGRFQKNQQVAAELEAQQQEQEQQ